MEKAKISVVIPVLKRFDLINEFVYRINERVSDPKVLEYIFVLAGRIELPKIRSQSNVKIILSNQEQRAYQMNLGAQQSTSEVLYFLHIDSIPPKNFDLSIFKALSISEGVFGCFRMTFDWKISIMSIYSYFTRFKHPIFHGGDASLFVERNAFAEIGGFDEDFQLMEDYDIIQRLKEKGEFSIIPEYVETSADKYRTNGPFRLQWIYFLIQMMYRLKFSQEKMKKFYLKKVR